MKRPKRLEQDGLQKNNLTPGPTDPVSLAWSPTDYQAFADHRLRPAAELLARVGGEHRDIVDLGCGNGTPTLLLARRWPDAQILGVDHAESMLAEARKRAAEVAGRFAWQQADVARWSAEGKAPDLIFSNACLHWLSDHDALFPRLMSYLAPAGSLAVQMPLSWPLPSHRLMREVLDDLGLADQVPTIYRRPVAEPEVYARRLRPHAATVDIWTTTYLQILSGDDPVYRWVESTGLRPVKSALHGETWRRFESEYRQRLRRAYPMEDDGSTLFPFRRLFLVAAKP